MAVPDANAYIWQEKRLGILRDRVSQVILRAKALTPAQKNALASMLSWASASLKEAAAREIAQQQADGAAKRLAQRQARYEEVRGGLVEPATSSHHD